MSDAGGAEGAEQDLDFGLDESFAPGIDITQEMRDAVFGYRRDPFSGELSRGAGGGGVTVAPELSAAGEGAADIKPEKKEEPPAVKIPEEPAEKEKPVITRAKRRRSLLTEEEGGILRKPTVYRRSILGR